jgi:hypothetical protein
MWHEKALRCRNINRSCLRKWFQFPFSRNKRCEVLTEVMSRHVARCNSTSASGEPVTSHLLRRMFQLKRFKQFFPRHVGTYKDISFHTIIYLTNLLNSYLHFERIRFESWPKGW